MNVTTDIAAVAALIGEPTRAVMLWSLLGGQARPASELAFYANVSAQSASAHLAKLVAAGMLLVESRGRHRYFRIARPEVALAIEAMAALTPAAQQLAQLPARQAPDLKLARTCYDHLAGKIAVALCQALQKAGWLVLRDENEFAVTRKGDDQFRELGIDTDALHTQRRAFARPCPDWSERQPHLAGAVGAALLDRMFEMKWIARRRDSRIVRLTNEGAAELQRRFKLVF
jgi:DNA-binding transcriptional ArsR family regulator